MPNVYAALPNYAVVNALQELRDQNKELKAKLEEHSVAMEKLQKGYDTLDTEFKMMQHNYSCLLMTTRAEVQRKDQKIRELSAGKELLAMNGYKSGKNNKRHGNQCAKNPGFINYVRPSGKGNETKKANEKKKADNVKGGKGKKM